MIYLRSVEVKEVFPKNARFTLVVSLGESPHIKLCYEPFFYKKKKIDEFVRFINTQGESGWFLELGNINKNNCLSYHGDLTKLRHYINNDSNERFVYDSELFFQNEEDVTDYFQAEK